VRALVVALAFFAGCAAATGCVEAAGCSLTLPTTIGVGNYDPTGIGTPAFASFTITYACAAGTSPTNLMITAGLGAHAAGSSFSGRAMAAGGTDRLNYWLYPPGYAVTPHSSANVWGDGSGMSKVWGPFAVTGGSSPTNGIANIQIESNQDVSAGTYSDTVVFTMSFF